MENITESINSVGNKIKAKENMKMICQITLLQHIMVILKLRMKP